MSFEIDWCCNKPFSIDNGERFGAKKNIERERERKGCLKKDLFSNKLTGTYTYIAKI